MEARGGRGAGGINGFCYRKGVQGTGDGWIIWRVAAGEA